MSVYQRGREREREREREKERESERERERGISICTRGGDVKPCVSPYTQIQSAPVRNLDKLPLRNGLGAI